jgi:hypothetical protein
LEAGIDGIAEVMDNGQPLKSTDDRRYMRITDVTCD